MKPPYLDQPVPFGIAHRGGTDVAPGNTEAAFQHAVSLGYRFIETDVQVTTDGVLVVFHDNTVTQQTGADGTIGERSWRQVTELRVKGEHPIPRFVDLLERFPTVYFNVEPKTSDAVQPLVELIKTRNLTSRICIGSFSDERIDQVRAGLGSEACTSPGPRGAAKILARALLGRSSASEHTALQIPPSQFGLPLVNGWLIERYHRQGLQVHVWTIDDEVAMRRLLDDGVDAVMTDEVALLKRVLTERGAWSAAADS